MERFSWILSVGEEASTRLEEMCVKAAMAGVEIFSDKDNGLGMKQNSQIFCNVCSIFP